MPHQQLSIDHHVIRFHSLKPESKRILKWMGVAIIVMGVSGNQCCRTALLGQSQVRSAQKAEAH
jgi:hypothetical protein